MKDCVLKDSTSVHIALTLSTLPDTRHFSFSSRHFFTIHIMLCRASLSDYSGTSWHSRPTMPLIWGQHMDFTLTPASGSPLQISWVVFQSVAGSETTTCIT